MPSLQENSDVFIADTMSEQNKKQCDQLGISWVACRDEAGFRRFKSALDKFGIPYTDYNGNLDEDLPIILNKLLDR